MVLPLWCVVTSRRIATIVITPTCFKIFLNINKTYNNNYIILRSTSLSTM